LNMGQDEFQTVVATRRRPTNSPPTRATKTHTRCKRRVRQGSFFGRRHPDLFKGMAT
jgi:hypothetical protein